MRYRTCRTGGLMAAMLVASLAPRVLSQSAFTQDEGQTYLQFSVYRIGPYDELFDQGGDEFQLNREVTETLFEAYGEYGLSETTTLLGRFSLYHLRAGTELSQPTLQPTLTESGSVLQPGNLGLGVRQRFVDSKWTLSGQLFVELPTSDLDRDTGLSSGYDAVLVQPTIAVGKAMEGVYGSIYAGFDWLSDDYSDRWLLGAKVGVRAFEGVWISGGVDSVQSFRNGSIDIDPENLQTGLFVDDQEYIALTLGGSIALSSQTSLNLTYATAVDGDNVPKSSLLGAGISFRW